MNKTASRVIDILEYISKSEKGATIADMSRDLDIPKSSVFDIVHTAADKGLLMASDTRQVNYRFGVKAIEILGAYLSNLGFWPAVHDPLLSLSRALKRSIYYYSCDKNDMILLDVIHAIGSISPQINVGERFSCFTSVVGRVFLASLPDNEVQRRHETSAETMAANREKLMHDLQIIRRDGFFMEDISSFGSTSTCISIPVFNSAQSCEGVFAVYDLANRLTPSVTEQIVREMQATALQISRNLGCLRENSPQGLLNVAPD